MNHFFALFKTTILPGVLTREDTRIYATPIMPAAGKRLGRCVGSVWMCNPGKAKPLAGTGTWGPIQSDPTLRILAGIFEAARLQRRSRTPPTTEQSDDYLEVLNLFHVCDPDVVAAWAAAVRLGPQPHPVGVDATSGFVWLAWGDNAPHGALVAAADALQAIPASTPTFSFYGSGRVVPYKLSLHRPAWVYGTFHPGARDVSKPGMRVTVTAEMARHLP